MRVFELERELVVARPVDEVFAFFSQARNLERITPPWLSFEVRGTGPVEMRVGTLIEYRLHVHGVPMRWVSRIDAWEPGRRFVDTQVRGPYAMWHHTHTFAPHRDGTAVRDHVRYALPLGPLGVLAHALQVGRDVERIFEYRREAVERILGDRREAA